MAFGLSAIPAKFKPSTKTVNPPYGGADPSGGFNIPASMLPKVTPAASPAASAPAPAPATGGGGLPAAPPPATAGAAPQSNTMQSLLTQLTGANPYQPTYGQTPLQQAQDEVALEYDPQFRELDNSQQDLARQYALDTGIQSRYAGQADKRLGATYKALTDLLQQGVQNTGDIYNKSLSDISGFYNEARQANQDVNQSILSRLQQYTQGLGIDAAMPGASQQILSDYGFMQGQNANNKASSLSNVSGLGAQMQGIAQQQVGTAAQSGAAARADVAKTVAKSLAELSMTNTQALNDILKNKMGLTKDRATALRQEVEKINQTRDEATRQARLDNLAEKLQLNTAALQNQQFQQGVFESNRDFNASQKQQQFDNSVTLQQLDQQKQELQAKLAGTTDPLEQQKTIAEIQKLQAETDKINGLTPGNPGDVNNLKKQFGTGENGVQNFMVSPQPGIWGANGAGKNFRDAVSTITQKASKAAQAGIDPYYTAVGMINEYPNLNAAALGIALQIYFNK